MSYNTRVPRAFGIGENVKTRATILNLCDEVERLEELAKYYPRVAAENERLRREVEYLKAKDFHDVDNR